MIKYVYLIQALESGRYKIGVSKNPTRRIKQLQTGSNEELKLIHSFKSMYPHKVEKALHHRYNIEKTSGEWYDISLLEELDFIDNCYKLEENIDILNSMGNEFI
jgi:predicted GIY-YIG superfamily endonuclease